MDEQYTDKIRAFTRGFLLKQKFRERENYILKREGKNKGVVILRDEILKSR